MTDLSALIFFRQEDRRMEFNKIVGLDYDDCEYEAGDYEEVPGNAEHTEYGSIFDERVVDRDV